MLTDYFQTLRAPVAGVSSVFAYQEADSAFAPAATLYPMVSQLVK